MNNPKHTPAPWFVGSMNDAVFIINRKPDHFTDNPVREGGDAVVIATPSMDCAEWEANARLIAAAPKLLEQRNRLLEACKLAVQDMAIGTEDYATVKAAIAAAEESHE